MTRRNFILKGALALMSGTTLVKAEELEKIYKPDLTSHTKHIHLVMNGALDDDLFVIKASKKDFRWIDCYQMHNPNDSFDLEGKSTKSIHIDGSIAYDKKIPLTDNEVLMIATANEREENGKPRRELHERTHYKSVPLYMNGKELFPSMLPENGDYADYNYPLWFGEDTLKCVSTPPKEGQAEPNYFQLWENACVNIGLVLPQREEFVVSLMRDGKIIANSFISPTTVDIRMTNNMLKRVEFKRNGKFFHSHPFVEINNTIFDGESTAEIDEDVRVMSADTIMLQSEKSIYTLPLPYHLPYARRVFYEFV